MPRESALRSCNFNWRAVLLSYWCTGLRPRPPPPTLEFGTPLGLSFLTNRKRITNKLVCPFPCLHVSFATWLGSLLPCVLDLEGHAAGTCR